jgi:hypothetical protein
VVIDVAVLAVTIAGSPLKSTRLSIGLILKFVPVMVTSAPTAPAPGVNEVMVGAGGQVTSKSVELATVLHAIVTVIGTKPTGPVGTVVVIVVGVLAVTVAVVPPKSTALLLGVVLKFVPVIVTVVPAIPDVGEKEVMVGTDPHVTVKLLALVTEPPAVVTLILPVDAPEGTVVVMEVAVLAVTTALTT